MYEIYILQCYLLHAQARSPMWGGDLHQQQDDLTLVENQTDADTNGFLQETRLFSKGRPMCGERYKSWGLPSCDDPDWQTKAYEYWNG